MSNYTKLFLGIFFALVLGTVLVKPVVTYVNTPGITIESKDSVGFSVDVNDPNEMESLGLWGKPTITIYKNCPAQLMGMEGTTFELDVEIGGDVYLCFINTREFMAHEGVDFLMLTDIIHTEVFSHPVVTATVYPTGRTVVLAGPARFIFESQI